jgi:hypothetical protein
VLVISRHKPRIKDANLSLHCIAATGPRGEWTADAVRMANRVLLEKAHQLLAGRRELELLDPIRHRCSLGA